MSDSTPASWTCRACGVPLRLAPGRAPVVRVCEACGAVHDLREAPPIVLGMVPPDLHRPEGLVEIGRRGRLGERSLAVVGRIRLGGLRGASFETFDDWELLGQDGVALRLRERQGSYALLLPLPPEQLPTSQELAESGPGTTIDRAGLALTVQERRDLRAVHLEGQLHHLIEPEASVVSVRATTASGVVTLISCLGEVYGYQVEPLEDRAMWAIFGYADIMQAYDELFAARERSEGLASAVGNAAAALLVMCLIGCLFVVFIAASGEPVGEGWTRFDFAGGQVEQAEIIDGLSLSSGLGFYRVQGECGMDVGSRELELHLEHVETGERLAALSRCVQPDQRVGISPVQIDFRWAEPGTYRLVATHTPAPGGKGRAHVSARVVWHLGNPWAPLAVLALLVSVGLVGILLWSFMRRAGLGRLEAAFEARRAELVLALRRRRHQPTSSSGGQP